MWVKTVLQTALPLTADYCLHSVLSQAGADLPLAAHLAHHCTHRPTPQHVEPHLTPPHSPPHHHPAPCPTPSQPTPAGMTLCFVAVDGVYAGLIAAQDTPRPEVAAALRLLGTLGCEVAMLTGDGPGVAAAVAAATGVPAEHVHASLLPGDKLDQVGGARPG